LGKNHDALDYYNQALPLWQAIVERGSEGETLANIGGVTKRVTTIGKRLKAFGY
jgi:hypothetical protein